jgi:hypothetical protein
MAKFRSNGIGQAQSLNADPLQRGPRAEIGGPQIVLEELFDARGFAHSG